MSLCRSLCHLSRSLLPRVFTAKAMDEVDAGVANVLLGVANVLLAMEEVDAGRDRATLTSGRHSVC